MACSIDRRMGHSRIDFKEYVWLFPQDRDNGLEAAAVNISESGIFVSAPRLFQVGTPLQCNLPLPNVDRAITLNGTVAWSSDQQDPKMGITFDNLTDQDQAHLREYVTDGMALEWFRPATVHFEDMPQPIRAGATLDRDGLLLNAKLNFLRLKSRVNISLDAEESYEGVLEDVSLRVDAAQPIPQLQLQIKELTGEVDVCSQTWTHWPPVAAQGQLSYQDCYDLEDETEIFEDEVIYELEALGGEQLDPDGSGRDSDPYLLIPEMGDLCEVEEAAGEQEQEDIPSTQSGSFHAREQPVPEIPEEHSVETDALLSTSEEAYELPSAHLSSSAWELSTLDDSAINHWDRVNERAQERRGARSGHLWLWLAALLMGGAVLASMVHTDVWSQAQRQFHTWFPLYQEDLALESEFLPETARSSLTLPPGDLAPSLPGHMASQPRGPVAGQRALPAKDLEPSPEEETGQAANLTADKPEPELAGPEAAVAEPEAVVAEPEEIAQVPEDATPRVTTAGEELILTIPFRGSLQEAVHYPLSQPEGLVVNLPHGKALAPLGNYRVKQGKFRLVWIRKRAEGIHIRVFFKGQQVPFKLELLPGSIQVKIKA